MSEQKSIIAEEREEEEEEIKIKFNTRVKKLKHSKTKNFMLISSQFCFYCQNRFPTKKKNYLSYYLFASFCI